MLLVCFCCVSETVFNDQSLLLGLLVRGNKGLYQGFCKKKRTKENTSVFKKILLKKTIKPTKQVKN